MKQIVETAAIFLIIPLVLFSFQLQAQYNTGSSISIGVVMPTTIKGLPSDLLPVLEAKMEALISDQGISANGAKGQSYVVYPVISVFGSRQTAGGMQKIFVVSGNLSLVIKQLSTNTIFSSVSKNIQGSGFNQDEATRNIFNQISPSDQDLINFVTNAKTKIVNYYNQNCSNLLKKSESEVMQKNYEAAMAILLSIPVEASGCYDKMQTKANSLYPEMLKYNCSKYLQQAETYAAGADYENALRRLSMIDPTVGCNKDVKALLSSIEKKVDNDKKKEWDLLFKIYEGEIEIAKAKAYAMSNFSMYWMEYSYTEITYDSVIR